MNFTKKELDRLAEGNGWDTDRHTLLILLHFSRKANFPGEVYALRRARQIIKHRERTSKGIERLLELAEAIQVAIGERKP